VLLLAACTAQSQKVEQPQAAIAGVSLTRSAQEPDESSKREATGGAGTLTGSLTYGIKGADSVSNKVEAAAAVRRLTPGAFDLEATFGTMETAAMGREAGGHDATRAA